MNRIEIVTDVGSDLLMIDGHVLPMEVTFDDEHYQYGPNGGLSINEFFNKLDQFRSAKTSQVTPGAFVSLFEPMIKEGIDILYLSLSSKLSGTYSASILAVNELKEIYPDCRITCIDSKAASTALGALVLESIRKRDEGLSYDELTDWINSKIGHISNAFIIDDLNILKRGGRISNTTSIAGQVLNLKPVLQINQKGELVVIGKARGRNGSIKYLTDFLIGHTNNANISTVYIGSANNPDFAILLRSSILQKIPDIQVNFIEIGPVIASHSGANTVMIAFI